MAVLFFVFSLFMPAVLANTAKCKLLSHGNNINALCNNLQLKSVPTSLPDNVMQLDLSHNMIRSVSSFSFRLFQHLEVLDLSYNFISHFDVEIFAHLGKLQELRLTDNNISGVTCQHRGDRVSLYTQATLARHQLKVDASSDHKVHLSSENPGHKVHLSSEDAGNRVHISTERRIDQSVLKHLRALHLDNNAMASLSVKCFVDLASLTTLTLSHNLLETINNDTFEGLARLQRLNLGSNKLRHLDQQSFTGLTGLQTLDLTSNELNYTETSLPPGVFAPVGNTLKSLFLHGNDIDESYDGSYPETVLMDLSVLETLAIDTFAKSSFGDGFAAMRRLTTLDLSHRCRLRFTNQTFATFTNISLQNLLISDCSRLLALDACVFCPLKFLTVLAFHSAASQIGLQPFLWTLFGLQFRNVSAINLAHDSSQAPSGVILNKQSMKFVMNICVKSLNLRNNQITFIGRDGLGKSGCLFTECIQSIDLSDNRIWQVNIFSVFQLLASPRLESVQGQLQKVFNLDTALYSTGNRKDEKKFSPIIPFQLQISSALSFVNLSSANDLLGVFPDGFVVHGAHSLKTLDVSYVGLYHCVSKVVGFGHLETLILSGNDCRKISDSFFDAFPRLKTLLLKKMNFDLDFIMMRGSRLFANLTRLKILDLSCNGFRFLPSNLLHAQNDLQQLLLAGNSLDLSPLDVRRHGNLTMLDLSDNALSQLNVTERSSLDTLVAMQPQPFHLRLHGNPLACTCTTLSFVRWLRSTRIQLDSNGDYSCVTDSGHLSSTATVADHWESVWRRCVGPTVLWAAVAGMLLLLSLTGAVWGVAANATRLRFLLRVFRRIKMPRREHFLRDVYIAYCDADTEYVCTRLKTGLQERRGVRLLIKDLPRNEAGTQFWQLPGDNIAEKMLDHIDLCWKVLLVITPALTRDPVAGFMTRAVLQSITDRMPDRVLLLCVGVPQVPALASLRAVLDSVSENQVFFLPAEADQRHPVWDKMADVILK